MQRQGVVAKACIVLFMSMCFVALATEMTASTVPTTYEMRIYDPRPVAAALELLERRHGVVITYEDPPYRHESDVDDVTAKVRRDLEKYAAGKAPKVVVPRAASIHLEYSSSADNRIDVSAVVQRLLDLHKEQSSAGVFHLNHNGERRHVVPTSVKGVDGKMTKTSALLDTKVTFPESERTGLETLRAIVFELQKAAPNTTALLRLKISGQSSRFTS